MNKSDSIKNLAAAMVKAQSEMGGAHKGANNPFFKSKYADLGAVVEAVKTPFTNNGLSYIQFPIEQGGRIGVETILMHESGEWLSNEFTVNLTKQDAQAAGSALTYCRRYALQAVAGIPSEDDDGNQASAKQKNDGDLLALNKLIRDKFDSITAIKDCIANEDYVTAGGYWQDLTKDDKKALWLAPTKGGIFTTDERNIMSVTEKEYFITAVTVDQIESEASFNNKIGK